MNRTKNVSAEDELDTMSFVIYFWIEGPLLCHRINPISVYGKHIPPVLRICGCEYSDQQKRKGSL